MEVTYYPGLTNAEKALIAEKPREALRVYSAMNRAERLTFKYLKRSGERDESDAFRHFAWAGLLVMELGADTAQGFLDAHEAAPGNPADEKAMDLANNRAGILEANRLKASGELSEGAVEARAIDALKQGKLVILKPRGGVP